MIKLKLKDIYPSKAQYEKNDEIEIIVELDDVDNLSCELLQCNIYRLHNRIYTANEVVIKGQEIVIFKFHLENTEASMVGFGVELKLLINDNLKEKLSTSFDIVDSWKLAPRYGFLSDFFEDDRNDEKDVIQMNKFHLNVVQFYDWMYRHHELLPPQNKFTDILGRELLIDVVKEKIDFAHKYGMKTMAYGAVYGAEKEFYDEHRDWGLIKNDGTPMGFIDFIYIMDISRECGWHDHIISEFFNAVKFGFDGIHMDQYGFPKQAISKSDGIAKTRYLREDYPKLINDTKDFIEKSGYKVELIFNAVNNYPIDAVAKSKQDAMYIEVWPPNDTYQDLYNLIINAKRYENNKQVILAAYMKPFSKNVDVNTKHAENATLMTMATIFASGGFHLLLGENNGILSEPYYPDHKRIECENFKRELRNYYDFIVRYEELLYSFDIIDSTRTYTGGINGEYVFSGGKFSTNAEENHVWTLVKEKKGYKIINLVNFHGVNNMNWNEEKESRPLLVENIRITALVVETVTGVFVASPDYGYGAPEKLDFEYVPHDQGKAITFIIPNLKLWNLIYITCI